MAGGAPTSAAALLANGGNPARSQSGNNAATTTGTIPASVNRKKQKRRQKQAARLAAEGQVLNGHRSRDVAHNHDTAFASELETDAEFDDAEADDFIDGEDYDKKHFDGNEQSKTHGLPSANGRVGHVAPETGRKAKKNKKKTQPDSQTPADGSSTPVSTPSASGQHASSATSHIVHQTEHRPSKTRSIWNTSTQEERENIKAFWLELGEEERRQLVKVEKDAVLKKMKEQQKHSCSCTVCGRKRTAIEEELEVLYDAYYEELEQYANHSQGSCDKDSPIIPPPRLYRPPLRSLRHHLREQESFHSPRNRVQDPLEDDEELDEEYDEDEEDDDAYSEDDLDDEATRAARADFFAFGNSLTVKDGILTVADDLLKNDGKHFIDMMEQLAERRMQREEDAHYAMAAAHQSLHGGHGHGPLDEDEYDDEEDEDYDSQDEEEYDEDEMDAMTEEQRMEEGRRMFQIFAARMFEQRVLTAYRERVAEQRQQRLIEELMEEQTREEQRSAKKAREAQKKKDKKKLQKQAKEEEKAKREAEKAAEEAAAQAERDRRLEEQRKKREEQRRKKEAEKKTQEEERARKEAEKQRRLKEEKERQAEAERRQREMKEQEKKRREESRRKEREEKEARERENREKREKEVRERKAREEQTRKGKTEQETRERENRELEGAQKYPNTHTRAPQSVSVPLPPNPQYPQANYINSPHLQSATPVIPKASTPARPRQSSQQGSYSSSPRSQPASIEHSQPSVSPRSLPMSYSSGPSSTVSMKGYGQQPILQPPQPSTPLSPLGASGRTHPPPGFSHLNGLPANPPGLSPVVSRPPIGHDLPIYPPHPVSVAAQIRGFPAPNGIQAPPGINSARSLPSGRGFPLDSGHGIGYHGQQPIPGPFTGQQSALPQTHSRKTSSSFENPPLQTPVQPFPVARPSPIKRPSSDTRDDQQKENGHAAQSDVDDLSAHLGSSALLDDVYLPNTSNLSQSLPGAATARGPFAAPARASFAAPSLLADPIGAAKQPNFPIGSGVGGTWGPQTHLGASAMPGTWAVGSGSGTGWPNNAFGTGSHHRVHTSRPVTTRLLVIQACKQLTITSPGKRTDGYHDVNVVLRQVEQLRPSDEPPITLEEILEICDTEGNPQNGGGSFSVKDDGNGDGDGSKFVKFEPDNNSAMPGHRASIAPGDIGSPVPGNSIPIQAFGEIGTPSVLRQYSSPPAGF